MQYQVIFVANSKHLKEKVNDFIEKGWKPLGGVSMTYDPEDDTICFAQAMIKEDNC